MLIAIGWKAPVLGWLANVRHPHFEVVLLFIGHSRLYMQVWRVRCSVKFNNLNAASICRYCWRPLNSSGPPYWTSYGAYLYLGLVSSAIGTVGDLEIDGINADSI